MLYLLLPQVGTEWVTKGQNMDQASNAVGGIARAIYHRTFLWLIEKCNETLIVRISLCCIQFVSELVGCFLKVYIFARTPA